VKRVPEKDVHRKGLAASPSSIILIPHWKFDANKGAHPLLRRPRRHPHPHDHDAGAGRFRVTAVENGRDCLESARRERFDLYLLDHTFPDASGVTICEELRKFDADTPILFYSGRAMPEEKEAAIKAGAQDYLIKPGDLFNVGARC
jgi:CheY-like chemotaxis protein